jgi:hypothetical protein
MAFDVGTFINSAVDWLATAPIVSTVVGNPLLVALMLTALMVLVITTHLKVSVTKKTAFKIMFYIFLGALFLLYLHYFIVVHRVSSSGALDAGRSLVQQVVGGAQQDTQHGITISPRVELPNSGAPPGVPLSAPPGAPLSAPHNVARLDAVQVPPLVPTAATQAAN